ncbi:hypothetical protein GCM10007977_042280 [Dactylosporangium sucinum]|uniref:Alpha/beta hydrolase fold-3 domain-containing protein n=3 Tax=Dactylosporangium sucinum TaxID=1424081 RepID=A0A917WWS5_9ACTN|nr:alpha/beta hydrolase [Dactylosporangium sucinum]GGM36417.1 hypothetical protein GCM10007977_042280 [Dactylosporangium sucinum]
MNRTGTWDGLHPQARALLERFMREDPPITTTPLDELRRPGAGADDVRGVAEPVDEVRDLLIASPHGSGSVPVRLYRPGPGPLPMLCYFHGGGFVFEDLDSYDPFCRVLANASGCLVASVGYRLAPEHPYPAGLIDCYTATAWLAANPGGVGARPGPVAIGGDSAGGNLAAAVALMARDRRGPDIAHQVLIYPFLDPACAEPSHARLPWPATEDMLWCWDQYLPAAAARDDPYAAPLSAGDHRGLPPAFVLTAEFDPLRDEGAAYAERLRVAGVPTRYECWPGQLHGFLMHAGALDDAAAARRRIGSALRRAMLP